MVKYIFAFPGQGAQTPGMIQDICSKYPVGKELLDKYSKVSGIDIPNLLWNSTVEDLARSDNSQTAITAASLAAVEILKSKGVSPEAAAGFSLGEWSALCVSGILSFEETVYAVKRRGEIMQAVCEEIASSSSDGAAPGMAAIIGLAPEKIKELIAGRNDIFAVNMNSFRQTVAAGTAEGLAWAENVMKDAGAKRYIRLKVAGPFHSPLMQKAADQFSKVLDEVTFKDPQIAIFSNVTGKQMTSGTEAKTNAVKHIVSPVLWTSEETEIAKFCKTEDQWQMLETGPGKVLSGLWKDSGNSEIIPADPWESSSIFA